MRIQAQQIDFRTISNEEVAFKMVKIAKYGHFEYLVEYPIWVYIKRTLNLNTDQPASANLTVNYWFETYFFKTGSSLRILNHTKINSLKWK